MLVAPLDTNEEVMVLVTEVLAMSDLHKGSLGSGMLKVGHNRVLLLLMLPLVSLLFSKLVT